MVRKSRSDDSPGVISVHEAYSKQQVMERLGISQRFWDQMLTDGLPYTTVGHTRWVTGSDLLAFLRRHARTKDARSEAR